jgi:uncharacterized protein YoxC
MRKNTKHPFQNILRLAENLTEDVPNTFPKLNSVSQLVSYVPYSVTEVK